MTNENESKVREFTLKFNRYKFDWYVLTQPTTPTEDGYETRVIEMSAYDALTKHAKVIKRARELK